MQSIFARLSPAGVRPDPFPHIVADDVVSPGLYRRLSDGFPPFSAIAWTGREPDNRRYALSAHFAAGNDRLAPVWRAFLARHSAPDILAEVDALLGRHWAPAMLRHLGGGVLGHRQGLLWRDLPEPGCVLQDARIEINTPVTSRVGSPRGPHLDTPNRLFSALLYMRDDTDRSDGGDLVLYRWRSAPQSIAGFEIPGHLVEPAATIPYRANRLVLFPQGLAAVHGVSPRGPTPATRRYVFITAETGEDWLRPADPCAC